MKTIARMICSEVLRAVGFVTLAFLLLFFFFDMVDQLADVQEHAERGYTVGHALLYVLLRVPSHLYELLPITVLIGTIYVMARLAESSEYTILRTSGLGPLRALRLLLLLGLGFVVLTFVCGDYIAPAANRSAKLMQARYMGDLTVGRTGAWMKDQQGQTSASVNVGALSAEGVMSQVRIYEFSTDDVRLQRITHAARAEFANEHWRLQDVQQRDFSQVGAEQAPSLQVTHKDTLDWRTGISQDMVAAALLSPDRMQTLELFRYIQHLHANQQSAQRYEIEFWRKVFYPLGCLVMMVLALPFAYLHFRSGNIAGQVFAGVLVGISFFLLNNVFGFVGNLREWQPWLAAAAPGLLYSMLSLGAFGWLVLRQ